MSRRALAFGALAVLLYLTVALSAAGVAPFGYSWNLDALKTFSDTFGPLNALLAAGAAIAAFSALAQQRKETEALARRAADEQASSQRRDFESTFFRLLGMLGDIIEGTEYTPPNEAACSGYKAFDALLTRLLSRNWATNDVKEMWFAFYGEHQGRLGHFFRLLYQIVRYIDEAHMQDPSLYVRILRSTLSNSQLVLLGLDSGYGPYPAMHNFVEKYRLLHNISASDARHWKLNERFSTAFGERRDIHGSENSNGYTPG